MDENVRVSVIVPVYNSEKYLRQCLDSICGQTLREIEIICVDDGSSDSSPEILREYQGKDERIRILTQKNMYAGAARNNGLEHAAGEYVIFWDSDDYFDLRALELMYNRAVETEADICICNAQNFDSETGEYRAHSYVRKPYPETETFNINDCRERIFTFTSTVAWNKLVRRQFMMDENIRFQTKKYVDDILPSMLELSLAKRITICNKRLVYYRMNREDSLMSTYGEQPESIVLGYEEAADVMKERGLLEDPQIRQSFANKAAGVFFYTMPYAGNYRNYLKFYREMIGSTAVLELGKDNINDNANMTRFLEMPEKDPDDFLFSEYVRLTHLLEKAHQKTADVKNERKAQIKELKAELKSAERELKAAKKDLKSAREDLSSQDAENARLKKVINDQEKILGLKSVRAGLAVSRKLGKIKHRNQK